MEVQTDDLVDTAHCTQSTNLISEVDFEKVQSFHRDIGVFVGAVQAIDLQLETRRTVSKLRLLGGGGIGIDFV